jgi:pyrroline-5-carboxylate reductase
MVLGFAGAGNMAGAMARGWAAGEGGPERMLFCDLDRERAEELASETGGETRDSLSDLAGHSDAVLLAVKPPALDGVAEEIGDAAGAIVSVMAATSTDRLADAFPRTPCLRVMPNQPVEVRRGVLCYVEPEDMDAGLAGSLVSMLGVLGLTVALEEGSMEAAMAIMSCSPAYLALVAGALADAGEREGLAADFALELVAETMAGTAELLARRDPESVKQAVAPPGGATEAGLEALTDGAVPQALAAAVRASLERFR